MYKTKLDDIDNFLSKDFALTQIFPTDPKIDCPGKSAGKCRHKIGFGGYLPKEGSAESADGDNDIPNQII